MGSIVNRITRLSSRMIEGVVLQECLRMGGWTEANDLDGYLVPDKLWQVLVANRDSNSRNPPPWYHRACLHCLANTNNNGDVNTGLLIASSPTSMMVQFLKRVQSVMWNWRFLELGGGGSGGTPPVGLALRRAEVDDIIAILFGRSVSLVLREYRTDTSTYYEPIGKSYVHGLMDGKALARLDNVALDTVTVEFELR